MCICVICYEFLCTKKSYALGCGHLIHEACFLQTRDRLCPFCRQYTGYIPLFMEKSQRCFLDRTVNHDECEEKNKDSISRIDSLTAESDRLKEELATLKASQEKNRKEYEKKQKQYKNEKNQRIALNEKVQDLERKLSEAKDKNEAGNNSKTNNVKKKQENSSGDDGNPGSSRCKKIGKNKANSDEYKNPVPSQNDVPIKKTFPGQRTQPHRSCKILNK